MGWRGMFHVTRFGRGPHGRLYESRVTGDPEDMARTVRRYMVVIAAGGVGTVLISARPSPVTGEPWALFGPDDVERLVEACGGS